MCKFNHNFFKEINNEHNAYWLGFIMADGHINDKAKSGALQLHIHLSKIDYNHLQKFHLDIDSKNMICFGNQNDIRSSHSSDILCEDLIKYGCTPRKSLTLQFPKQITTKMLPHFIRGYFDGDGSTCLHKDRLFVDFLGTQNFLIELNKKLPIQKNVRVKKDNLWILQFSDISGCKEIYDFMYKDATIFLQRKKETFDTWLNIPKMGSGNYDHKNHCKSVIQKDLDGNIIKIWPSLLSIENELNISRGWISNVCQKKEKTAKGYVWEYKK